MRTRNWGRLVIMWVAGLATLAIVAGCASGTQSNGAKTGADNGGEQAQEQKKEVIKFADMQWQSLWINNAIAGFIIEHGYGYPVETVEMTTPIMQQSVVTGDVDVVMEMWKSNIIDWYNEQLEKGAFLEAGPTFERATQGWYVPRYLVEGDPERGIEPQAPDLKSVFDLPKYKHLFKDPEDPDKGLLINCVTGWQCAKINLIKLHAYGLADDFNVMEPGASAALDAAIAGAYKRGEPFLAYYWEPTWLAGTFDLIQLEEPAYNAECDAEIQKALNGEIDVEDVSEKAGCSYQVEEIGKIVYPGLKDRAPEVVEFLNRMFVGTDNLNKVSAYMENEEVSAEEAAIWFFENFQDTWREWVDGDVEKRVEEALKAKGAQL